ncbi:MAG: hypothetical protein JSU77_04305 [Fidelibacterota bacterium]|nr:MAG: hypothetical protein JSU77_04305 [Candidatus Neomarinimicrobiota bacterium]
MRPILLILWLAAALFLYTSCGAGRTAAPRPQDSNYLEPYILIGESGKSVKRTASDIIGRLFMQNFQILGKYAPADDPGRFVIVVTNPDLLNAVQGSKPAAALAAVVRIAITREGEMTYVSCQNPDYWASACLQEDYLSAAEPIALFKQDLLAAMPRMRGRFNRPFGNSQGHPLTAEALHDYRFQRGAESLNDLVNLAIFDSFEGAVAAIEKRLAASRLITKVFGMTVPGRQVMLFGLALGGDSGEKRILTLLDADRLKRTASLPYELLVSGNRVAMLPVRFRLPLSFPDMDRKTYRRLEALEGDISSLMTTLVE